MNYEKKYLKYKKKYTELTRNQIGGNMNIMVRISANFWAPARDYQESAFKRFKQNGERPYDYDNRMSGVNQIKFTIKRIGDEHHGGIYMLKSDGTTSPIADWNDVKCFIVDIPGSPVNWRPARAYQTWAYFDFIYSSDRERRYYKWAQHATPHGTIEIPIEKLINEQDVPIDYISTAVNFRISRNDNGTIFYEKDNSSRSRVRISDNDHARHGYAGFYMRMTEPIDFTVIPASHDMFGFAPNPSVHGQSFPQLPVGIIVKKTQNDEIMCAICNDNEQNIQFLQCGHHITCSECYLQLVKPPIVKPPICPYCRGLITGIQKYTPPQSSLHPSTTHDMLGHTPNPSVHGCTILQPKSDVWFDRVFKFHEMCKEGMPAVRNVLELRRNARSRILVDIRTQQQYNVGVPIYCNTGELLDKADTLFMPIKSGRVSTLGPGSTPEPGLAYYNIFGNTKLFHLNPALAGSLFQVASQFNALEMSNQEITPEHGITMYQHDHTQGPACAMVCPYGTLYRNYFSMPESGEFDGGPQTSVNQKNTLDELEKFLGVNLIKQNGYNHPRSTTDAETIETKLKISVPNNFFEAIKLVKYFIQHNTPVVNDQGVALHNVSQIYCSALPIFYFQEIFESRKAFASMILHAVYFATLALAAIMAITEQRRVKVFLTRVGGGVFANPPHLINAAIKNAVSYFKEYPIDVFMVNFISNVDFPPIDQIKQIERFSIPLQDNAFI